MEPEPLEPTKHDTTAAWIIAAIFVTCLAAVAVSLTAVLVRWILAWGGIL